MTDIINKYSNSKIYKICSNLSDKYYIGSTFKRIEQRLKEHITSYKAYLTSNDKPYLSSYKILQHSDYYIELLELYPCNTITELHCREGELIKQFKSDLVNLQIPCEFIIKKKQEEIEQRLKDEIRFKKIQKREEADAERQIIYINNYRKICWQECEIIAELEIKRNISSISCSCGLILTLITLTKYRQHIRTIKHAKLWRVNYLYLNELNYYNF